MTLDLSKPVRTKSGHPVRILCTDAKDPFYSVVGLVLMGTPATEHLVTWTKDGYQFSRTAVPSENDLVNVPQKHVCYLNIYSETEACFHQTRLWADEHASTNHRTACVRVEYTDGQMDD